MRILKNRGDIFFSKTDKEKSSEQKFLITALVIIIILTLAAVVITAAKSDFSVKKFFAPDNLEVTQQADDDAQAMLPEVSGKNNFLLLVSDEKNLLYACVIQTDMDNVSYKVCSLRADTVADGQKLGKIFSSSSAENVKTAVETLLGTEIDYYISLQGDKFAEVYDKFGEVNYPVASAVKYRDSDSASPYSVRVKEGEQSLKGTQVTGLMRYYLDVQDSCALANDLMLAILSQQINENNYEIRDELFSKFISSADTNITVRDYSAAGDALAVLSNSQTGVSVYNAAAEYGKGNEITKDSLKEIRGYFVK